MKWLRRFLQRGLGTFRRRRLAARLDEELRFHLDMQARDNEARGLAPAAARRAARLSLAPGGSLEAVRQRHRAEGGLPLLETLVQDVRYALRMLRKSPGFTAVALLSLAFGIGTNCAIFSLVDALLLRPLPVPGADRLVVLGRRGAGDEMPPLFSYVAYRHLAAAGSVTSGLIAVTGGFRVQVRELPAAGSGTGGGGARAAAPSAVAATADGAAASHGMTATPDGATATSGVAATADGAAAAMTTAELVSGNFFAQLGAGMAAGRAFTAAEDRVPGGHPVAVLSYGYWQRAFGRDSGVVGRALAVNGAAVTVLGVAGRDFQGVYADSAPDLFLPLTLREVVHYQGSTFIDGPVDSTAPAWEQINLHWLQLVARRRPGVSVQQAGAVLNVIFARDKEAQAATHDDPADRREALAQRVVLRSAARGLASTREQLGTPLLILLSIAGLVLLIACANVANLLLARADRRQKEMAVRLGIGAGRARLVRQLLTESLLLSGLGGALGLLLAFQGSRLLVGLVQGGSLPLALDVAPDGRKLAFAAVAALLTGVVFGLAPALQATRVDLAHSLKEGAKAVAGGGRGRRRGRLPSLGALLVAAQVALSLVLLIGAGLFVRSLQNMLAVAPGFAHGELIQVSINPHLLGYDEAHRAALYDRLRERLAAMPGVRSVSLAIFGPFSPSARTGNVSVPGAPSSATETENAEMPVVTEGYFETVGIPLLAGRSFARRDRAGAPKVAVVNETFARTFFHRDAVVGRRFGFGGEHHSRDFEIVGLVRDAKYHRLGERTPAVVYMPFAQSHDEVLGDIEVRVAAGRAAGIAGDLRRVVAEVSPDLAVVRVATSTQRIVESLGRERAVARLTGFFGLLALLLAAVGLYGVMSYGVARRTGEIGLRMALGAPRAQVLALVLRQTAQMVALGVAAGLAAAFAVTRVAASQLFGVTARDPATIAVATLVMVVVALLAGFLPARRAAGTDPMVALRYE